MASSSVTFCDSEISEYRTCPICGMRCENHGTDYPDWHTASGFSLTTEGCGADGVWYCSDSCRNQAMYQEATPDEQRGFRELTHTVASLPTIAKHLGFRYDGASRVWELPSSTALCRWDSDGHIEALFCEFMAKGMQLCKAIYGSADNEQPAFAGEAENEVRL